MFVVLGAFGKAGRALDQLGTGAPVAAQRLAFFSQHVGAVASTVARAIASICVRFACVCIRGWV